MKHSIVPLFLAGIVLLLVMAVPVSADLLTVTDISPSVGYTGETVTVTITGTNFTTSDGDVRLEMSGEDDIDASRISSWSDTRIVCKFKITTKTETGDWTLIVTRDDDEETEADEEFTITDPIELTSISPTEGQMENESVDFTLKGSGLSDIEEVYLYNNDYDKITADIDEVDSDEITGTFDLSDTDEDKYKVCVEDSYGTVKCALSFLITTDEVGSITVSSSPTDASFYVDNEYIGTTPGSVGNLVEGAHKVAVKKTGYIDWADVVLVSEGDETDVNVNLVAVTTIPTTVPTPVPTTERMEEITPGETPTPLSTPVPTTQKSPVGTLSVIGIICLAFIALRKH
ncbi:MAG: PEGA domain-containing protein [Methanoregula sp.]|jgi:hypothetical protein